MRILVCVLGISVYICFSACVQKTKKNYEMYDECMKHMDNDTFCQRYIK